MFYILSLLYHIFLLISYRIKIYIQYHYVYYICTLYLYLIYLPLKFTSILFQKIRRCAPHIENYQRPPTLTLGSTFHTQYRHIPITASRLFHSQHPLQAVLLHRLNLSFPTPSHTDTSQQNSRPPQPSTPKKSPRGVQRGRGFAAPLRFSFFLKKILHAIRQKSKRHTVFKKKVFLTSCYFT